MRQDLPRALCEILKEYDLNEVLECQDKILSVIMTVSEDPDPEVKTTLLHEIPTLLDQCQHHNYSDLELSLIDILLPIAQNCLYDSDLLISNTSYAAVISMLERFINDPETVQERFCPIISSYVEQNEACQENINTSAIIIKLIGRIALILGSERTEKYLLNTFLQMCSSNLNTVRQTCAYVFSYICYGMGREYTENKLLDHFFALCNDSFWRVRRACAEKITLLAMICSLKCRREKLSPVVLMLAKDDSKCVVSAILKELGSFIAAFAQPCIIGSIFDRLELRLISPTDFDFMEHASQELIDNFEYYKKLFSIKETWTNHCQKRCYDDALSAENIAQKIVENKTKLFEQINNDSYLKKSVFNCLNAVTYSDLNKDDTINKGDNKDIKSGISLPDDDIKMNQSLSLNQSILLSESGITKDEFLKRCPVLYTKEVEDEEMLSPMDTIEKEAGRGEEDEVMSSPDDATEKERGGKDESVLPPSDEEVREGGCVSSSRGSKEEGKAEVKEDVSSPRDAKEEIEAQLVTSGHYEDEKEKSKSSDTKEAKKETSASSDIIKKDDKDNTNEDASNEISIYETKNRKIPGPSGLCSIIKKAISTREEKRARCPTYVRQISRESPTKPENRKLDEPTPQEVLAIYEEIFFLVDPLKVTNTQKLDEDEDEDAFKEYNSNVYWHIAPDTLEFDVTNTKFKFTRLRDFSPYGTVVSYKPPTDCQQDIVPPEILKLFLNMVLYKDEAGFNLNCAYNFPAIALTIGRGNWHIIKSLLLYLCDDLDWKVRKTVAISIDWIAKILGRDITTKDLLPIYAGFFKDLDEVKIEAIKNLANFLQIVHPDKHEEILSKIGDCLRVDSKTNWRIKEDLAKQITSLIKMYSFVNKQDSLLYITSLTALFLEDKISRVREIASDAMAEIIKISSKKEQIAILNIFLVEEFALNDSWRKRQTFVNIISKFIKCDEPSFDLFYMVLSTLEKLSYDYVANVRLLVAKILLNFIKIKENILQMQNPEEAYVVRMIKRLQNDCDTEIRELCLNISFANKQSELNQVNNKIRVLFS